MKCKDCNSTLCSYRTSDAEMNCFYERHPDCTLPIDMWSNNVYTDWRQVRIQAAIAAMQSLINNQKANHDKIQAIVVAQNAVGYVDALIEVLMEK